MMMLMKNMFMNLPVPSNISYAWNFGSLLLLNLVLQIATGLFLAMHYYSDSVTAFNSVAHIMVDVNGGWLMRYLHMNGASTFFIFIYFHMARSVFYGLYRSKKVWLSGMMILFLLFAIAFVGYVLPWGQMSFWGATVITSLLSTIPYIGNEVVNWVWGGFAVGGATLSRFFTFHFILPFVMLVMVMVHLLFLHEKGSSNPLGVENKVDKISFHPYFSIKDMVTLIVFIYLIVYVVMINPLGLNDPENFIPANPLTTPVHIKPEWYYLFAYAILRSIPSKVGGTLALVASISIFGILPLVDKSDFMGVSFYPMMKMIYWVFVSVLFLLTWIGGNSVEYPFIIIGQLLTLIFFMFFFLMPVVKVFLDKI